MTSTMTSRERVRKAMKMEIPDRVPVMCQLSQGYMAKNSGVPPMDVYTNADSAAHAFSKTRKDLNFDGVLLNIAFDENWREKYEKQDQQVQQPLSKPDIEDINIDEIPVCLDYTDRMVLHRVMIEEGAREEYSVHGEIVSPFDCLVVLLGIEGTMMALISHPEECAAILKRYIPGCVNFAKTQIDVGVDAIKISSPFVGGSFISCEHYKNFVVPYEKEVVRQIHEYSVDMPVYTHTCGFIGDRLELMADTGIDGIECMDPPPLGDTMLADAKKRIGSRLFLKGNMDSVNMLLHADANTLEECVKQMIKDGAKNGGYILSSACSVAPDVNPEIMKMLVPLAEKYGRY